MLYTNSVICFRTAGVLKANTVIHCPSVQVNHYQQINPLALFLAFLCKMQYERSFFKDGLA